MAGKCIIVMVLLWQQQVQHRPQGSLMPWGQSSSTAMICTLARTSRRWRRAARSTTKTGWLERDRRCRGLQPGAQRTRVGNHRLLGPQKQQYHIRPDRVNRLGEFPVSGWAAKSSSAVLRTDAGTAGPLHARNHGTKQVDTWSDRMASPACFSHRYRRDRSERWSTNCRPRAGGAMSHVARQLTTAPV